MNDGKDKTIAPGQNKIVTLKSPNLFGCGAFIDLNLEIDRLRADASFKEESGHKTKLLLKYPEFRIALIFMGALSRWDDHQTRARIFIHVLRGHIQFHTPDGAFALRPGQLLALDPGILHSVDASEESAFLLTLSDPK